MIKKLKIKLIIFILIPLFVLFFNTLKPMPSGTSFEGYARIGNFTFLSDLTYEKDGKRAYDQEIFTEIFKLIKESNKFILIDYFLFNDDYDRNLNNVFPEISKNLTDALLEKKRLNLNLPIILITDPINFAYGSYVPKHIEELKKVGVQVVVTNLFKLRDSNALYSSYYRPYFSWFPNSKNGIFKNAFDPDKPNISLASYLELFNLKANHRKIIMNEKNAIISSANPHDGSFFHSNIAFKVDGAILEDILTSEKGIMRLSNANMDMVSKFHPNTQTSGKTQMKFITEGKIKEEILNRINSTNLDNKIKIGMFYLSDRDIIKSLKKASDRGVLIQIILDINKDAFGRKKIGIPNKPVANELMAKKNIEIRWYETKGEQYHSKFIIIEQGEKVRIIGGSANYTRRNIGDLNLEANIAIYLDKNSEEVEKILNYYDKIWNNKGGIYTAKYEKYREKSTFKKLLYLIQEETGLSSF
ncbi:hypothetical protein CBLAS_1033 [Campylobacter blaseri]|uniref:phospholipase D n=1 Tax=Campylobacter blaseri TaxID=2042961 RepID=A0A2P8QYI9_9BACT|nr:phospholipase D-like domain-containing protein [Campylobacter blaseri]PSM51314.1 hypothetical protein CQ405_08780 [Campylobacter blaseri]PSM52458.1 hypothetical protein CRN67_08785 [Campylobacter blaseri]QKF86211.1 hypothetical protein CBLAS_1033 [Campylobacter blaseri]